MIRKCAMIFKLLSVVTFSSLVVIAGAHAKNSDPVPSKITPKAVAAGHATLKSTAAKVATPDVSGKTEAQAEAILKTAGLRIGRVQYVMNAKGLPGKVVRQSPRAKTAVARGSMVSVWILKSKQVIPGQRTGAQSIRTPAGPIKPKLVEKNKKLILTFPVEVENVRIADANGNVLLQLKKGRRFDITQSVRRLKTPQIAVRFTPPPPSGGVPKRRGPTPEYQREMVRIDWRLMKQYSIYFTDNFAIDAGEPANNTSGGATLLSRGGHYAGEVGGVDDPQDNIRFTSGPSGAGTLVEIEKVSGRVRLHLYGPVRTRNLENDDNKVWIAVKPNTTVYFMVEPTDTRMTIYRIRIRTKVLRDDKEPNDTHAQAKTITAGRTTNVFLGHLINSAGRHEGLTDFYKINVTEARNMRVNVTNAGLQSDRVAVSIYEPDWTHANTDYYGSSNSSSLTYLAGSIGYWKIGVDVNDQSDTAYGTGAPPQCYKGSGYTLEVLFAD